MSTGKERKKQKSKEREFRPPKPDLLPAGICDTLKEIAYLICTDREDALCPVPRIRPEV